MNSTNGIITVFAGSASRPFAQKMCDYLGVELGKSTTHIFSEGGIYVRADESIRNKDVYIVQSIGKDPNNAFTELIFWIDAFKRASANSITAIIPYFGYAKADKKDEPRVSIRARVCADCIEMCGADRVVTMDLHAAQVQGFFSKPVDHLYASALLCDMRGTSALLMKISLSFLPMRVRQSVQGHTQTFSAAMLQSATRFASATTKTPMHLRLSAM